MKQSKTLKQNQTNKQKNSDGIVLSSIFQEIKNNIIKKVTKNVRDSQTYIIWKGI